MFFCKLCLKKSIPPIYNNAKLFDFYLPASTDYNVTLIEAESLWVVSLFSLSTSLARLYLLFYLVWFNSLGYSNIITVFTYRICNLW